MTPENLPNGNPIILLVLDALGIPHQVAPLNHSHNYNEVPGLSDDLSKLWIALNEKANSEAVNEALEAKADITTMNNALAGKMPNMPIDNNPEADSRSLVYSGGVAGELAKKAPLASTNVVYYDLDGSNYILVDQLFTSGNNQVTLVIENVSGNEERMNDVFKTTDPFGIITPDLEVLPSDSVMVCRVIYCQNMNTPAEKYIVVLDRLIGW